MSGPKRVQMTRPRVWRADNPDAVIVARPSKWGNPFAARPDGGAWVVLRDGQQVPYAPVLTKADALAVAVDLFRMGIHPAASKTSLPDYPLWADIERELAGRDLACWCPLDQPCHADVLLAIAAGQTP